LQKSNPELGGIAWNQALKVILFLKKKSDFQNFFAFLDLLPMMSVVFSFHFSGLDGIGIEQLASERTCIYIYVPYPRFQGVPFLPRNSQG